MAIRQYVSPNPNRQVQKRSFGFIGDYRPASKGFDQIRVGLAFVAEAKRAGLPHNLPVPPAPASLGDSAVMDALRLGVRYAMAVADCDSMGATGAYMQMQMLFREIEGRGAERESDARHEIMVQAQFKIGEELKAKQKSAQVYFIREDIGGTIKIGFAYEPLKRLAGLQTSHHAKLTLLATAKGGVDQEGAYHRQFAAHRVQGEWFTPAPDILAEIDRLNSESV